MAEVKVPKLLHKMSLASQKAWYKKHGMEMPSVSAGGKSAAQAKKDVGEINKQRAKEKSALQKALETSPKQKELKKSSARVQQMAANALAFGGQRPGGDLTTARGIVSYIRGGGYLKAGRLGEETVEEAVVKTKEVNKQKLKNYVRGLGTKAVIAGKVPFDQVHSPLRAGRKVLKQEEAKPDASMAMTHTLKMKAMSDKDKRTLGKVAALMAAQKKKVKEQVELDEGKMKDIVTDREETARLKAQDVLGGPVKEKPKMPPGKQPAGYRYVRGLARRAMKAGMKKEEVDLVSEQDDTMEKKEMAQTQLHFMKYAAEEILEFIKMGGEIEEWYQNKLSKVHSDMEGLHSYIEGEKRRTGMAEEVENVSEGYKDGRGGYKKFSGSGSYKQPLLGKEGSKRKRHISDIVQSLHSMDASKPISADHHAKILKKLERLKEEVVAEAEGTVAVTPKEKALAAHHGDPKKITYGDVIKARLKSVAAKKMGK